MRASVTRVIEGLIAGIMVLCVFIGLVLMMIECPDWNTQLKTLFIGVGLFLLGTVPGAIFSYINSRKENNEEWSFRKTSYRK